MREEYRARGDLLVKGLNELRGVSCATPSGAFYVFPQISGLLSRLRVTTDEFSTTLLQPFGLASLPGTAFGPSGVEHLRLSFATSRATLERAVQVLKAAVFAESREVGV
jgi:aspartate aminotransferase